MAGRRPIPTKLKVMRGNPGKRALNKEEPQPPSAVPECPPHLSEEGQAEWKRITPELHRLGILARIDRAALAGYCQAWARWVDAELNIRKYGAVIKTPKGYPIQSPYLSIANTAIDTMRKFLTEFGMTPSSRSRIHAKPDEPAKNDDERYFG